MKKTIRIAALTTAALVFTGACVVALQAEDTLAPQTKVQAQATTAPETVDENLPKKHRHHHHGHRHTPPLVKALDSDGDGSISSSELANASTSLAKLDKNGDGNLTRDELRPKRWKGRHWKRGSGKCRHHDFSAAKETLKESPAENPEEEAPAE
jgi:hypothetical protein